MINKEKIYFKRFNKLKIIESNQKIKTIGSEILNLQCRLLLQIQINKHLH